MAPWSLLAGTSRLHEAPPTPGGLVSSNGPDVTRRARRLALVGGAITVWGLAGILAWGLEGHIDATSLAPFSIASVGLFLLLALVAWKDHRALQVAAALAGTVALSIGFALVALTSGTAAGLLPPTMGGGWGWLVAICAAVLVPLAAGARLVALERSFDMGGRRAGMAATFRVLATRDAAESQTWARAPLQILVALGRGLSLAGTFLLDAMLLPFAPRDRVHADADPEILAAALVEIGATCDAEGAGFLVRLPPRAEGIAPPTVRMRFRATRYPWLARRNHIELSGDVSEVRRLRACLEGPCCSALVFSWSATGARIEKRLNTMLREAQHASTLEERSLLLDEANKISLAILERDLNDEEHAILSTLKSQRLRGLLATRMLSEPPGGRQEGRVLAPGAAMAPPLANVLDAGGLSAVKRLIFVPHWIVPFQTTWGEQETLVNALTGKVAPHAPDLLDAMRRRAPAHFHEAGSKAQFIPAPPATAALLRELRGTGGVTTTPAHLEMVYVPFVAGPEGYVNAVTGDPAPDLGPSLAVPA